MILKLQTRRPAFSMITAIFIMLLMATVGAFIMNLSGKMVQETTTQYRKEQAILYAKSYTEFAIMSATARTCVKSVTADVDGTQNDVKQGQGYRVVVNVRYLGNESPCPNATYYVTDEPLSTPSSRQSVVLIDTYVHYRDPDNPSSTTAITWATNPGITYHRRTIQKL